MSSRLATEALEHVQANLDNLEWLHSLASEPPMAVLIHGIMSGVAVLNPTMTYFEIVSQVRKYFSYQSVKKQ